MNKPPSITVLSLGTNIEPRQANLNEARERISNIPSTRISRTSSIIETDPVDVPEEFLNMKFLNQVVIVETTLDVKDFSDAIHKIEDDMGRIRGPVRNTPRPIDIDIITFDDLQINTPELTLPHPRAHERDFVMKPLREIIPNFTFPASNQVEQFS
jgi:2-amino-4-hydroxy-6-hydroxymethyldihydropteridine diphosphokinase